VDAAYRASSTTFTNTFALPLYGESKTVTTAYPIAAAPAFDVGFHCVGRTGLGFAVGFMYYGKSTNDAVNGSIPHPFFFNQFRTVSGQAAGITRTEVGVNFDAAWAAELTDRVQILVSGGPSLIHLSQGLVTDINVTSNYPYDLATFDSASSSEQATSKLGVNAGIDLTYMFTRSVGVGGSVQYAHARATLTAADGQPLRTNLGAAQVGAGVRFRF
jgi:hypothetical protein